MWVENGVHNAFYKQGCGLEKKVLHWMMFSKTRNLCKCSRNDNTNAMKFWKKKNNLKFGLEMQLTIDVVRKDVGKRPKDYTRFWSPKQG